MNRLVVVFAVMSLSLTVSNLALGAEDLVFVAPEDMDEGSVMASTTRGVVESIDLENRTLDIGGYSYYVGFPDDPLPVKVTMVNSDYGAFELLRPNMKVEIVYGEIEDKRLAVRLQQLADSTELEVF